LASKREVVRPETVLLIAMLEWRSRQPARTQFSAVPRLRFSDVNRGYHEL